MASIGGFFKAIAPMLTTAISFIPGGGPAVTIASSILSKVTGSEVKPESIQDVLTSLASTEEGRLKLQESEQEYQKAMAQLGYQDAETMASLLVQDRDSARKREIAVKDKMPMVLAILAVLSLMFCISLLAFIHLPEGTKDGMLLLIGFVGASYKDVYGYFFGSSAGSDSKTAIMGQQITDQLSIKK